ncbi:hypothetical protein PILCRDRAFT_819761 [Piloderma croceum F 1598]|uniref:MYND-type domain-containing protein n=1 Tax=Piloderma croceum (strain F 1598) TaxID=765440 RepID=A0A0C3FWS8_PILCF|nr:hypothetical protein PILCRDRAFT_819761 [Piloderma croceum F 1598]
MSKIHLSNPLLPAPFVQQVETHDSMRGFKSSVYDRDVHGNRLAMRTWLKPASPDCPVVFPDPGTGFTREAQRTWLHHYAMEGDVLALSEMIGLGATADLADSNFQTPLHLVFLEMAKVKTPGIAIFSKARRAYMGVVDKERLFYRLAWVARILIEQHAKVDIMVGSNSLIDLSCTWKDWDTIALLLKHGAAPLPTTISRFRSSSEKKRFSDLLKFSDSDHPRPPRICPCWSGKVVSDCHGKSGQPYPLEYMCVCGSAKTYQKCCHKRGKLVIEKWDNKSQRILHDYDRTQNIPEALRGQLDNILTFQQNLKEVMQKLDPLEVEEDIDKVEIQKKLAADLLSKGLIDPAFAYAMDRANFVPFPHGRTSSQHLRKEMEAKWNKLVDDYIHQGRDSRSRVEIERCAKVGSGNGPLFNVCGASTCGAYESESRKFSCCAKCKRSFYCGKTCQKLAWRTHKTVCCSEGQREPHLPSQEAIRRSAEEGIQGTSERLNVANATLSILRQTLNQP